MDPQLAAIAQTCLASAYEGSRDFPTIVGTLIDAGFEGYSVDYRLGKTTYFLPSGAGIELTMPTSDGSVAGRFDATAVQEAVHEAQTKAAGYSYAGFCKKVKAAGCAGYLVSFLGRRVVYYGRTAETHVELFPQ